MSNVPPTPPPPTPELSKLRTQIDALDAQIVDLLNERAKVVVEIGKVKQQTNAPIYAPDREKAVLEKVRRLNQRAAARSGAWRRCTAS